MEVGLGQEGCGVVRRARMQCKRCGIGCAGRVSQAFLAAVFVLAALTTGAAQPGLPDAPQAPTITDAATSDGAPGSQTTSQKPKSPKADAKAGQVHGMVVDQDGAIIEDADVVLHREGSAPIKVETDVDGRYRFLQVSPGGFRITANIMGMTPGSYAGNLQPNESFEVPTITLRVAKTEAQVQVYASQQELAEAEIKVEEHQRLAGILPNFFVTYDWHAPPLTTRQKFELAYKNAIDPGNFFVSGIVAGVQQANGTFNNGYGQGVEGYAKRYGAATADLVSGTFLGGAVYPTIFHQDPRYFYKGTGSIKSRALYAMTRAFVAKGDNGKWQPAYAGILGDMSAGAVSNLYYPAASRNGAALTFEEGLLNIGGDMLGGLVQEFVDKHLTPHAPNYSNP